MNLILSMMLGIMLLAGARRAVASQSKSDTPAPAATAPAATVSATPAATAQPSSPAKSAAAKPAAPVKPAGKPAKLEHMQKAQAEDILGDPVLNAKGDQIGHIVNVLVNAKGTPHAAVIEFAGFLGVGNRNIAVAWKALNFKVVKNQIIISLYLDAAQLKAMPVYNTDAKSVPVAAPAKPAPAKPAPAKPAPAKPAPAKPAPAKPAPAKPAPAKPAPAKPAPAKPQAAIPGSAKPDAKHQGADSPPGAQ
jgi:sporulation protein YlmC with PRC-barrel domain